MRRSLGNALILFHEINKARKNNEVEKQKDKNILNTEEGDLAVLFTVTGNFCAHTSVIFLQNKFLFFINAFHSLSFFLFIRILCVCVFMLPSLVTKFFTPYLIVFKSSDGYNLSFHIVKVKNFPRSEFLHLKNFIHP